MVTNGSFRSLEARRHRTATGALQTSLDYLSANFLHSGCAICLGKLTLKLASQPAIPLFATSASDFDVERVGAKVRFVDEGSKIVRLEITQGGRTLPATRD